ncbi:MAG: glycoside hydrolase family 172 protein [Bacteroidota bacterium]
MKKSLILLLLISVFSMLINAQVNSINNLFDLSSNLQSRSISFENPTGEPGEGGKAASEIGVGRKGAPRKLIEPGETVTLCDINQAGTIRHIWMTGEWTVFPWEDQNNTELIERNKLLRSTVIRAYWDEQEHPSIECPLGDFMGIAHATVTSYQSAVHSVGQNAAFNIWLPMPFTKGAKITLTNDSEKAFYLYYQIDYTINDKHEEDVGRLHVSFRRENPTTPKEDFEIMPKRTGKGRFIGAVIGVRTLYRKWWGEGEIKFFMDGDTEFPTICGTGSEDYVGLSYRIQQTPFLYHGCNLNFMSDSVFTVPDYKTGVPRETSHEFISMYRWHITDPIYWKEDCTVTIQQIGCCYYERRDDWSAAAFWYEPIPSTPLPELPSKEERIKDLKEVYSRYQEENSTTLYKEKIK